MAWFGKIASLSLGTLFGGRPVLFRARHSGINEEIHSSLQDGRCFLIRT